MDEPPTTDAALSAQSAISQSISRQRQWVADYVQLLMARCAAQHLNLKQLSEQAGMSRQTLSRKLRNHEFSFDELKRLLIVLDIDGQCAMLAIEHEGDWRMYDSNPLELAARLAKILPGEIAATLERDIQPLKPGTIRQLAREMAQRIAQHDDAVLRRRDCLQV